MNNMCKSTSNQWETIEINPNTGNKHVQNPPKTNTRPDHQWHRTRFRPVYQRDCSLNTFSPVSALSDPYFLVSYLSDLLHETGFSGYPGKFEIILSKLCLFFSIKWIGFQLMSSPLCSTANLLDSFHNDIMCALVS